MPEFPAWTLHYPAALVLQVSAPFARDAADRAKFPGYQHFALLTWDEFQKLVERDPEIAPLYGVRKVNGDGTNTPLVYDGVTFGSGGSRHSWHYAKGNGLGEVVLNFYIAPTAVAPAA